MKIKSLPFKSWVNPSPVLPITRAELIALGITEDEIAKGEARGELETWGPWQQPLVYKALCMSVEYADGRRISATAYGIRTMGQPKQSGHVLEGRVSVLGKSVRGFTSSQLFELEDGSLVDVAVIYACL